MQASDRLTLTVREAAAALGVGKTTLYQAIKRGEVPAIVIGKRVIIPRHLLERLLAGEWQPAERARTEENESRQRAGRRRVQGVR